ncbi:hypothetical protein L6R53_14100 [Myxococcota bacterium]|nr:hypothetical protein [Myxococcota bacterium]
MAPWTVLSPARFFSADTPAELIQCSTCRDYRRYVPVGERPASCPFCARGGRYGGLTDASPTDATPVEVDTTIPAGACAAGVARVG